MTFALEGRVPAPGGEMTVFKGEGLACERGERLVFAGLSFAVDRGGVLVLTGPNGSGKSSLLRLMAGLLKPADGLLSWDGQPVSDDPEAHRHRLHYLGHLEAVKPVLTPIENLAFWAAIKGGGVDRASLLDALDRFGLKALADMPSRYLSAGQRRRLALARLAISGCWTSRRSAWTAPPSSGWPRKLRPRAHAVLPWCWRRTWICR